MQSESSPYFHPALLRINSRYRSAGTSSNLLTHLDNRLVDISVALLSMSASIPRLFGNIYSPINVLTYTVNNDFDL
jgi:hypothetical protein